MAGRRTHRLIDIIFKALSGPLPERMPAGSKAMMCHAGFGGISPDSGQYYCFLETLAGGYGGRQSRRPGRGADPPQNTENAPIEETERNYPVRILRYELIDDSDGARRVSRRARASSRLLLRPGPGHVHDLADRDREGPRGLFGGQPGKRAEYFLNPDGDCAVSGRR